MEVAVCDVERCAVERVMDVICIAWRRGRYVYRISILNCRKVCVQDIDIEL